MTTSYPVGLDRLVRAYGLTGVALFPRYASHPWPGSDYLSAVGLPHDDMFLSFTSVDAPDRISVELGLQYDRYGWECPPEARSWLMLGVLPEATVAVDPESGVVYELPDNGTGFHPLHRDVPSLVHCLVAFREIVPAYETAHEAGDDARAMALIERFRQAVTAVDPTPFENGDSSWSLLLDEMNRESRG